MSEKASDISHSPEVAAELEPISSTSIRDQVIGRLRQFIEDGNLGAGDQLPGERELADRLQVSRGTIREALQFMQALGQVERRHGRGTFLLPAATDSEQLRAGWRGWIRRHASEVRELLEVRRGLESFAAGLAARRREPAGLDQMKSALELMQGAAEVHDVSNLVQADLLFHAGLVEAAGNSVLEDLTSTLGKQLIRERAGLFDMQGRPARSLEEHRRIYEAIAQGDPDDARRALLDHLDSVQEDMELLLSGEPEGGGTGRKNT